MISLAVLPGKQCVPVGKLVERHNKDAAPFAHIELDGGGECRASLNLGGLNAVEQVAYLTQLSLCARTLAEQVATEAHARTEGRGAGAGLE